MGERAILTVNNDLEKINYQLTEKSTKSIINRRFKEDYKLQFLTTSNDKIYEPSDMYPATIFHVVEYAYSNHLSLEFVPDDWLHAINFKISRDIKEVSDKEEKSGNKEIRGMFVNHESTKKLTVVRNDTNYIEFIKTLADMIQEEIKVPELAVAMKSDFSTSSNIDKPISSICLANAMSNYFTYEFCTLCGIKNVTLKGTEDDWKALVEKVKSMRKVLELPLGKLGYTKWFNNLQNITENLLKTYQSAQKGETMMADWWRHIFSLQYSNGSGPSTIYNGWIFDLANINLPYGGSLMSNGRLGDAYSKVDFVHDNNGIKSEMKICGGVVGYDIKDETLSLVKAVAVYKKKD